MTKLLHNIWQIQWNKVPPQKDKYQIITLISWQMRVCLKSFFIFKYKVGYYSFFQQDFLKGKMFWQLYPEKYIYKCWPLIYKNIHWSRNVTVRFWWSIAIILDLVNLLCLTNNILNITTYYSNIYVLNTNQSLCCTSVLTFDPIILHVKNSVHELHDMCIYIYIYIHIMKVNRC
jgi:hypothetical protein